MRLRPAVLLLLLLGSCRPPYDTEIYARTRREMARFTHGFAKTEGPSTTPLPAPWAPGQFAVWAITADERTTLVEAVVEDVADGGTSVSVTMLAPTLRTTARVSFDHQPKDLADARASLREIVRRRGDQKPFTYRFGPNVGAEEMRDALQPLWGTLVPTYGAGETQTVSTAAATLQGCTSVDAEFVYRHTSIAVHGWAHPAVPISGFVKGKAKGSGEDIELMEYGWTGGAPSL
jgi:hypothetical protein